MRSASVSWTLAQRQASCQRTMSDESQSKNIASVWILVVLLGGLSVPFWRWDDSRHKIDPPLQWVESQEGNTQASTVTEQSPQQSLVSATSTTSRNDAAELLNEFQSADPALQIQDAINTNQQRPGIPKQFQGVGIPLTEIKPWLPKPIGYDAAPSEKQKLAGSVNAPIQSHPANLKLQNDFAQQSTPTTGQAEWPDNGFAAGQTPIAPPTMFYRAEPLADVASDSPTATPASSQVDPNAPGRMVSSTRSTSSDPPALLNTQPQPLSNEATATEEFRNQNHVKVTPSPAITPPTNPLRSSTPPAATPKRKGTVISQPKTGPSS